MLISLRSNNLRFTCRFKSWLICRKSRFVCWNHCPENDNQETRLDIRQLQIDEKLLLISLRSNNLRFTCRFKSWLICRKSRFVCWNHCPEKDNQETRLDIRQLQIDEKVILFHQTTYGSLVGSAVGSSVGINVGSAVGSSVGIIVGSAVGSSVGIALWES